MPSLRFTEQEIESANASSIVDFLTAHGESVKRAGGSNVWYSPSGKVSITGNQWYSHYELIGGNAIAFVVKFFNLSFPDAVRSLLGQNINEVIPHKKAEPIAEVRKPFILPKKHTDMRRLYGYLIKERHIDPAIVSQFVKHGLMYEDAEHHNAVFVGKDKNGNILHAHKRSTSSTSSSKINHAGSIAEYSFHYNGLSECLFVFEAPIDMLAYISMHKQGWETHSYVALCSTSERAALQMLKDNSNLKAVYLCLDNDSAGHLGCERIAKAINDFGEYKIERLTPQNKDWDEDLKALNGRKAIPASN